jgi:hypothetical protein
MNKQSVVPLLHHPQRAALESSSLLCKHSKARHERIRTIPVYYFLPLAVYFLLLFRLLVLCEPLIRTRFSVQFFFSSYLVGIAIMIVIFIICLFFSPSIIHSSCCIMCHIFIYCKRSISSVLCSIITQCRHLFTFTLVTIVFGTLRCSSCSQIYILSPEYSVIHHPVGQSTFLPSSYSIMPQS